MNISESLVHRSGFAHAGLLEWGGSYPSGLQACRSARSPWQAANSPCHLVRWVSGERLSGMRTVSGLHLLVPGVCPQPSPYGVCGSHQLLMSTLWQWEALVRLSTEWSFLSFFLSVSVPRLRLSNVGEINTSAGTNNENPACALLNHRRKKSLWGVAFCQRIFPCFSYLKKCSFREGRRFGSCSGLCR